MSQRRTSSDARPSRHEPRRTTDDSRQSARERERGRIHTTTHPSMSSDTLSADEHLHMTNQQEREAKPRRSRSVGAATLAAPRARSIGMQSPDTRRRYGRGETVRKVEEERLGSVRARPAVYTAERHRAAVNASIPAFAIPVAIACVVLAAFLMLSGPLHTYYEAWREAGVLEVRYEALQEQNAELMEQLDRLQSIEGIEDEARRRGYAYPDEEVLIVDGLEEEKLADPAKVDAAIEAHEENLPWYVHFLDALFGYERT